MPLLITGRELQSAVQDESFIQGGVVASAEGVKYDFRLSSRILKAEFGRPVDYDDLSGSEKSKMVIEPGEVVFVLTAERLVLPMDMIALLSPKRKLSHAGILTLGGSCIDPGYEGRLLIGLLNLSSTPFPIIPEKKLIAATFQRLQQSELNGFPAPAPPFDDFPDELVQVMQNYKPVAIQSVAESVRRLQEDLTDLRSDIRSHETWYSKFEQLLDAQKERIGELNTGLEKEVEARRSGQTDLEKTVKSIEKTLSYLRGIAKAVFGLVGLAVAVAVGLAVAWISGWLPNGSPGG